MKRNELDVRDIPGMSKEELLEHWAKLARKPPPKIRSKRLLVYAVAWELQARREGGLVGDTRRRLAASMGEGGPSRAKAQQRPILRPQSRLVRRWGGRDYEVVVLPKGFLYEGRTYRSLSQIAREITGTRWNGPAFFGLRKPAAEAKNAA